MEQELRESVQGLLEDPPEEQEEERERVPGEVRERQVEQRQIPPPVTHKIEYQ
jgi:hypothetical protein